MKVDRIYGYCLAHRAPRRHPSASLARGAALLLGAAHGPTSAARWNAGARGRAAGRRSIRAPTTRRARAADGPERILIAPSSPLGIEWLPEAETLLDAFHDGVLELGAPFELWAGLVLADATPERVDALLDRGAIGLSLPAGALGGPAGIESLGPALERLAARGAPLFVHPGPAAGRRRGFRP